MTFKTFSRHIRDVAPGVVIVVGGAIVTADPVYICKQLNLDYGVVGEGEETVLELASLLLEGGDPEAITGLVFRRADGTIVSNPARVPSLDIDDIPWPDWEGFNLRRHHNPDNPEGWKVPILCSRSCPFKCTFCAHAISNYRMRKFENVFKEMEYLVEHYNAKGLELQDDMFSVKRERVSEFCQRITPLKLNWEAQVRVGVAESGLLKEMFEAGCRTVSYGFESYDLGVLRSMRKKIAPSQIDKACKLTYDNKISIQGNFLFSDVAETADSVNQTINWWARNRRYAVTLYLIKLFPGTELYRLALAQGKIAQEDSFYTNLVNPKLINLSSIPDPDYAILCEEITVSADILSFFAPIKSVRLSENRQGLALELICPHCGMVSSIPKWRHRNIVRWPCPFCRARFWTSVTRGAPGLFPKEHTDLLLKAAEFLQNGNPTACCNLAAQVLAKDTQDPAANHLAGAGLMKLGRDQDANNFFRGALMSDNSLDDAQVNSGVLLCAMGQIGWGLLRFQKALLVNPDNKAARANAELVGGWIGRHYEEIPFAQPVPEFAEYYEQLVECVPEVRPTKPVMIWPPLRNEDPAHPFSKETLDGWLARP